MEKLYSGVGNIQRSSIVQGKEGSRNLAGILSDDFHETLPENRIIEKYCDYLSSLLNKETLKQVVEAYLELDFLIQNSSCNLLKKEFSILQRELSSCMMRALRDGHDSLERSVINGIQISVEEELFRLTERVL